MFKAHISQVQEKSKCSSRKILNICIISTHLLDVCILNYENPETHNDMLIFYTRQFIEDQTEKRKERIELKFFWPSCRFFFSRAKGVNFCLPNN